jgi:hypothetical protein
VQIDVELIRGTFCYQVPQNFEFVCGKGLGIKFLKFEKGTRDYKVAPVEGFRQQARKNIDDIFLRLILFYYEVL